MATYLTPEEREQYCLEYRPLAEALAVRFYSGITVYDQEVEDYISRAYIGLWRALGSYRKDRKTAVTTFITLGVTQELIRALKWSRQQIRAPRGDEIYLDQLVPQEDGSLTRRGELIADTSLRGLSPEAIVLERVENAQLLEAAQLSPLEAQSLECYHQGYTYEEIAHLLSTIDRREIKLALRRARNKIKRARQVIDANP